MVAVLESTLQESEAYRVYHSDEVKEHKTTSDAVESLLSNSDSIERTAPLSIYAPDTPGNHRLYWDRKPRTDTETLNRREAVKELEEVRDEFQIKPAADITLYDEPEGITYTTTLYFTEQATSHQKYREIEFTADFPYDVDSISEAETYLPAAEPKTVDRGTFTADEPYLNYVLPWRGGSTR